MSVLNSLWSVSQNPQIDQMISKSQFVPKDAQSWPVLVFQSLKSQGPKGPSILWPQNLRHWSSKIAGTHGPNVHCVWAYLKLPVFRCFQPSSSQDFLRASAQMSGSPTVPTSMDPTNDPRSLAAKMRAENSGILASQLAGRGGLARWLPLLPHARVHECLLIYMTNVGLHMFLLHQSERVKLWRMLPRVWSQTSACIVRADVALHKIDPQVSHYQKKHYTVVGQ